MTCKQFHCLSIFALVANRPGTPLCVGRVFAVDLDRGANGTVSYESVTPGPSNDPGFFSVDPNTGHVCSKEAHIPQEAAESVFWVS